MKKSFLFIGVICACILNAGTVVTGPNPNRFDKIAEQELLEFLPKLSGEPWCSVPEGKWDKKQDKVIFLGDTGFARSKGIKRESFGPETWQLKSFSEGLVINGGKTIGTLYGVYDLLKQYGVRFFAVEETYVPKVKSFQLPRCSITKTPSYEARLIYDFYPHIVIYSRKADMKLIHQDYNRHRLRIGACGTQLARHPAWYLGEYDINTVGNTGHTYVYYVLPDKYMKEHPEYYSMDKNGKRFFGQLCLSNPEVRKVILKELREYIKRDRANPMHGVGAYRRKADHAPTSYKIFQMDGYNYLCCCPECMKISEKDGDAGLQMQALNYVAREIGKEYPDVEIVAGAYCSTDTAPKITRPEKNLSVSWTNLYLSRDCYRPMTSPYNKNQLKKLEDWLKISKVAIYDYWNMGGKFYFYPPRQEIVADAVIADLRYYHSRGIRRFMTEYEKDSVIPQPFFDLHCYLAAELLMDVNCDAEKIMKEFILHFYGEKASASIWEYFNELRKGVKEHPTSQFTMHVSNWKFATPQFLSKTYRHLTEAEKLAGSGTKYGKRIRELMIPLLWEICFFHKNLMPELKKLGVSIETLRNQTFDYTKEYISKYGGKAVPAEIAAMKNKLDYLFIHLSADDKFPGYSSNDIKVFGYPHARPKKNITAIVDDPDTPVGKSICCFFESSQVKHGKKNQTAGWCWATGFYMHFGNSPRKTVGFRVKNIPQDEKYHWYKIPDVVNCTKDETNFWTFYGYLHMDLSTLWRQADGRDDMNLYDVWFSAKFTGPAYVKGSKQKNAIWVDRVVTIWHKAKPEK